MSCQLLFSGGLACRPGCLVSEGVRGHSPRRLGARRLGTLSSLVWADQGNEILVQVESLILSEAPKSMNAEFEQSHEVASVTPGPDCLTIPS